MKVGDRVNMQPKITLRSVDVVVGRNTIQGDLRIPQDSTAIVVFAHGSGSSRHSPRNKFVADILNQGGLATLLVDLLTPSEEAIDMQTAHLRFDIPFLADRLVGVTDWLATAQTRQNSVLVISAPAPARLPRS